jgi:hypothetical protein
MHAVTPPRGGRASSDMPRVHLWQTVILTAMALVVLGAHAFAAGISGLVTFGDQPVPGATVTASNGTLQVMTVTDDQGAFTFSDLDAGVWSIRVEMSLFAPLTREVTIPSPTPAQPWALSLATLQNLVAAASSAPAGAAASASAGPSRSTSSNVPRTANATSSASLPSSSSSSSSAPSPAAMAMPTEPASDAADGLLINGSVNNGAASPIAQSPAFGNNRPQGRSLYTGGAAVVYGSSAPDSRPFALSGLPTTQPDYQNVRVIGTLGGPLKITRALRTDPTFFVSVQHSGNSRATTQSAVVPTAAERGGDFSQAMSPNGQPLLIIDPATGAPFPENVIPSVRLSPQALALLQYYPMPTSAGAGANFQAPLVTNTDQTLVTSRVTQGLGVHDQLVGQLAYQHAVTNQTTLFGFTDASGVSGVDTSVAWTHRVSTSSTLRVRYQFTGVTNRTTPFFANRTNVSADAGLTGNAQDDPANWGLPTLQFSSLIGLSDALPDFTRTDTGGGGAEVTWSHGHHNLTFGGDLRRITTHTVSPLNPRGSLTFTGTATGSDLADFLLGLPAASAVTVGDANRAFVGVSADAYLSDDWRFSPTLTFQVGARWEVETPPTERLDQLANLDVAPGFGSVAPVLASRVGSLTGQTAPAGIMRTDWSGLQPRVSTAWRPIPGSSLLVRAGYGVYRNTGIYSAIDALLAQQPPLSTVVNGTSSASSPLLLANAFTGMSSATPNTFAVDPNLRVTVSQDWQVLVQRDVWGFLTVSASYLGTRGDHLFQEFLPNTYPVGAVNPCPTCPAGFVYLTSGGHSSRHAGQWQVRWRLHRGLAASVQYTLSKATDDAAAFTTASLNGSAIAQNWRDLSADEGPSNFDQRHQVVSQVQYTTGIGMGGGGLMGGTRSRLFGGWTIVLQLTAGSGLPFTPVYLVPVPGTSLVRVLRPDVTGASTTPPDGAYLNPAAYTAPAPGTFGNAPRNSVRGPAQFSCDLGAARTFTLTRRLTLDWRIDATNVLNRETDTTVDAIFGGAQFGLPTQVNTPRQLLSTMRLRF